MMKMSAKDLISNEIPVIGPSNTPIEILSLMEELKVNALPLTEEGIFRCLLSEKELLGRPDPNTPVGTPLGFSLSIRETAHLFDALDRMSQSDLDILPVVSDNNRYVGSITRTTILRQVAIVCDASMPGAIVRLEINQHDFVLSELARIAEQNNARIINLFTYPDYISGKLQVLIKVDQEDATYFMRSLERFNYIVIAHYHHDGITDEVMQQRIDELLYYIEM